jgi:hypothetical protein
VADVKMHLSFAVASFQAASFCAAMIATLLTTSSAAAASRRVMVIEFRSPGFKHLGQSLRQALGKEPGVEVIAESQAKAALKTAGARPADVAKSLGADVIVRAKASGGHGRFVLDVSAETVAQGRVLYSQKNSVSGAKLSKDRAAEIARAIRVADATGVAAEQQAAQIPDTEEIATEEESSVEALRDQEEAEPIDNTTKKKVQPDGRRGLVAAVGFGMLSRQARTVSSSGTPPRYEGSASPGFAFNLSLFPARFNPDAVGIARDFGVFVRGTIAFMNVQLDSAATSTVYSSTYASIRGGAVFRHVFSDSESAAAFGGELGLAVDAAPLPSALPYPSSVIVSPSLHLLLEVPFAKKYLVWVTRAGVMPIVYSAIDASLGQRRLGIGVDGTTGFRSTLIADVFYAEAIGMLTHYWNEYRGSGSLGYPDVALREFLLGVAINVGVTF